jgi:predicted alpha/beta superfamily hydrolase
MKINILFYFFLSLISFGQNKSSITFKVQVPSNLDEVYVTGNQENIGNWEPSKIKMNKISDFEREITLVLTLPVEFKFTKGNWESEAIIKSNGETSNLLIENNSKNTFFYKVRHWLDEEITNDEFISEYEIKKIYSKYLDDNQSFKIYLPDNYSSTKKYPVLYFTDSDYSPNFELLVQYYKQLEAFEIIPECILVGVMQQNRNKELDVFYTENGKNYKDYLFNELIPFINSNYYVSGFNTLIGHSDGATYNHILLTESNCPFDGFISLSANLFNNQLSSIDDYLKSYNKNRKLYYFLANGNFDDTGRFDSGKAIENVFFKYTLQNINFENKIYNADHNNLVAKSLLDGIQFIFKDYRGINNYKDFYDFSTNYENNIINNYGIKPIFFNNDIDYFFGKILEAKDASQYENLISFCQERDLFATNSIDRANHYFAMDNYAKCIEYWNKSLESIHLLEKRVFYYNFNKALISFDKLKQFKEKIVFLEKCNTILKEYKLEFWYFIAKTITENNLKTYNSKKYINYCKINYKENRYFTLKDLEKISK